MRTLPDIENILQPLERAILDVLIPSLIGRNFSEAERDLAALLVRMGSLWLISRSDSADAEYSASITVSAPLVSKIEAQSHPRRSRGTTAYNDWYMPPGKQRMMS